MKLLTGLFLLTAALTARADITPNPLFSDHMVLQQGMPIPVWGAADPGEQVTVTLGGAQQTATASADGRWIVRLPAQKAAPDAPPTELTIAGKNTITLHDVLIGEVWLGTGQSNMVFPVSKNVASYAGLLNEQQEIAAANYPAIRMFTVTERKTYEPQATERGQWQVCSPQTVSAFSAVGYLFARDLQKAIRLPVGIITIASGASTAEAWISRPAFTDPLLKPMLDGFDASVQFYKSNPTAPIGQAPIRPTPINKPRPAPTARQSDPVQDQHEPTVLFNGMLNPIIPYAFRGALWYQGESVCGGLHGVDIYSHVLAAMLADWRSRWAEGDFPFLIVQLPGQQNLSNNPLIRQQQAALLNLAPNTHMACIIDTGEAHNVHPHNKAPLGDRLARLARATVYGEKIEYSGPVYDSMKIEGSTIRIKFTHLGAPDHAPALVAKGAPGEALKWFQIAGADQKFVDATATMDGDTIIVSSPQVPAPIAVRYAWDNFPEGCNLYNAADLPASPFRTDTWKVPLPGVVE